MAGHDDTTLGGPAPGFPATNSQFLEGLGDPSSRAGRASFEDLCRRYWKPIYCFVRLSGSPSNEDAKDLTQAFFAWLLNGDVLARYERERAPFRQYLKGVLRRFLSDARESAGRIKRGGAATFVPVDGDGPSLEELCADPKNADPTSAFDRAWLASLIDHAVGRLRERIRPDQFRVFQAHDLAPDADRPSYGDLASRFGISEDQVRRILSTLRGALREEMRAELRRQTTSPEDFDEEWHALRGL